MTARFYSKSVGAFPLTGWKEVNTYHLFTELCERLVAPRGRAGLFVKTGIGCAENCLSFWWGTDTRSRIVKFIRPPAREKKSLKRILPRPELIRMIDDAAKHCDLTSEQRFAWARFMAALRRRKLI